VRGTRGSFAAMATRKRDGVPHGKRALYSSRGAEGGGGAEAGRRVEAEELGGAEEELALFPRIKG